MHEDAIAVQKPRLTYAQFLASQQQPVQPRGLTLAKLIDRYIREMNGLDGAPPVRTLGDSHYLTLRRIERSWLGKKVAAALTKQDVIDYCRWRAQTVKAPTINQDVTYLSGALKYAGSAWDDALSAAAIEAAKPFLRKHQLIGTSTPRERRPTLEELERLIEYFARPERRGKKRRINMVVMTLWQWYSARRVGESCEALWKNWRRDEQTLFLEKVKDPKRRGRGKLVALTNEAQQLLIALWEIRDPAEPRIFPYYKKSVSAAYTVAKKALGIVGLRLHDSRRDRGTRLVEDEGYTPAQACMVTGHDQVATFERSYLKMDVSKFRLGPQRLAAA